MTHLTANSMSDLSTGRVIPFPGRDLIEAAAPFEGKWPAWKVAAGVIVFCSAFWWGVIALVMRLMEAMAG